MVPMAVASINSGLIIVWLLINQINEITIVPNHGNIASIKNHFQ